MKRFFYCIFSFLLVFNTILIAQSITWEKAYIQPGQQGFSSIIQTEDDQYIAVGNIRISPYDYTYIVKLNIFGDTIWTKTINGYYGTSVIKTIDNNYAICTSDGEFIKFDINGNILIRGSYYNIDSRINKIIQTPDGNYFMCGAYWPSVTYPELLKYDVNGNLLWDSVYYSGFYWSYFTDMILYNNNFVLTGININVNFFIMSITQNGERNWYNSPGPLMSPSKITLANNNILISGTNNGACLAKFTVMGENIWIKRYDTTFVGDLTSVIVSKDGNYVSTGYLLDDRVSIMKTDTNGNIIWQYFYGYNNSSTAPFDLKQTTDSGFIAAGRTNFQLTDCYVLKTDKNGYVKPIGIIKQEQNIPQNFVLYQNYPNPFNSSTIIKFDLKFNSYIALKLYDIRGALLINLLNKQLPAGNYSFKLDMNNFSTGVYFYQLVVQDFKNNYFTETKKILFLK